MSVSAKPVGLAPAALVEDPVAWDAFVTSTRLGSYLLLDEWRAVKAVNGWSAIVTSSLAW